MRGKESGIVSFASGPHALDALAAPPAPLIAAAHTHLRRLGLVSPGEEASWRMLGGGVSNWVILFDCGDGVVVKGALARLRVRDEWLADPTRAVLEGRAMAALGARLPAGDVPHVLFVDEGSHLLGMSRAPAGAYPWKEALLRGDVDVEIARGVGALLGRIHAAAWGDAALARQFDDLALFHQLRLDPYHERAALSAEGRGERDLAERLRAGARAMTEGRATLVHGDFSPKNLLVHGGGVIALDFEVVHWGNPDFDTAFLLTHLALKAVHRPGKTKEYAWAADAFLADYTEALGRRPADAVMRGAARQAGCLLVARADGKSPAEYLDEAGRMRARALGAAILRDEVADVVGLFAWLEGR